MLLNSEPRGASLTDVYAETAKYILGKWGLNLDKNEEIKKWRKIKILPLLQYFHHIFLGFSFSKLFRIYVHYYTCLTCISTCVFTDYCVAFYV